MKKSAGFTLLELLIAATILGIMVVFAATSYQNSMAETRLAAARGRLDVLAAAVQRYQFDYGAGLPAGQLLDVATVGSCTNNKTLFNCGFLENGGWSDSYVRFYVCNNVPTGKCYSEGDVTVSATVENPFACMQTIPTAKWPKRYQDYTYCANATASGSN